MAEEIEVMKDPFKGFEFPSEKEISKATKSEQTRLQQADPVMMARKVAKLLKTKSRPFMTPYGEFNNAQTFHNTNSVTCTFNDCSRMMPHLYYFVDEGPGKPTYEEVLVTPYHVYPAGNNVAYGSWKDRAWNDAIKYNCVTEPKRNKDAANWYVRLTRSW